jgi:hypothetical protein
MLSLYCKATLQVARFYESLMLKTMGRMIFRASS